MNTHSAQRGTLRVSPGGCSEGFSFAYLYKYHLYRHSMAKQMMIELATNNHSQALANYVRGEEPDDVGN